MPNDRRTSSAAAYEREDSTFRPNWKEEKTIEDRETGVACLIRKSDHNFPRFSVEFGFIVGDERKFGRYRVIGPRDMSMVDSIGEIAQEAEKYIAAEKAKISKGVSKRED